MHVGACVLCMNGSQRTPYKSRSFPSTMEVPVIKLKSLALATLPLTCLSYLTSLKTNVF